MGFDFASAKLDARRTVHATFGVQGFYSDDSISDIEVRARWHDKTNRPIGDLENGGYAQIVEGIDRIVFLCETTEDDEAATVRDVDGNSITLQRGGRMTFPKMLPTVEFELDYAIPADGPIEEIWSVTRKETTS